MKKKIILLLTFLSIFTFTACENSNSDALKFKEEYEKINGEKNSMDLEHRTLSIDSDNPFVYITPNEIIKKIENKETFYLYFGSEYCPWCRSVIEQAIASAKKNDIKKIYYFNIWDGDHNEIFRDTYSLNEENELEKVKDGTDEYYKILELLDNVLSEYTLKDSDNNVVKVNEKRIFAPTYIYIEKGESIKMTTGISKNQKDSRAELTDEVIKDEQDDFDNFFKN